MTYKNLTHLTYQVMSKFKIEESIFFLLTWHLVKCWNWEWVKGAWFIFEIKNLVFLPSFVALTKAKPLKSFPLLSSVALPESLRSPVLVFRILSKLRWSVSSFPLLLSLLEVVLVRFFELFVLIVSLTVVVCFTMFMY